MAMGAGGEELNPGGPRPPRVRAWGHLGWPARGKGFGVLLGKAGQRSYISNMSTPTRATILCPHCKDEHIAKSRFCPRTSLALPPPGESPAEPPFQPRKLNDTYELLAVLGYGAQGCVYRARQAFLSREVAIKEVAHAGNQARLDRELRVIGRLSHRNIVVAYHTFVIGDHTYLVMELAPGTSLRRLLDAPEQGGRLTPREALAIARTLCDALAYAHGQKVVHRDLKPENVVVPTADDEDLDQAKLVDFGVARLTDPEEPALTHTGVLVGTLCYMSPEQCQGLPGVSAAVDVYALGVMLYEMLTGRLPFPQQDLPGLVYAHCNTPPPRLAEEPALAGLPFLPELSALVSSMMAKDPAARPLSAEAAERIAELHRRALARAPRVAAAAPVAPPAPDTGIKVEIKADRDTPLKPPPSTAAATVLLPSRAAVTELTAAMRHEQRLLREQVDAVTEDLLALLGLLAPRLPLAPDAAQATARAQDLYEEICAVREQLRDLNRRREEAQDVAAQRGAARREALFALILQRHPAGAPVSAEQLKTLERRIDETLRQDALAQQQDHAAVAVFGSQIAEVRRWLDNREVELTPCVCDAAHAMAKTTFPLLLKLREREFTQLRQELDDLRARLVRKRSA